MNFCHERGWTLVEMLIAMALSLLLTLLLVNSWQVNQQAFKQTSQLAEMQQSGQFVLGFFQQELLNQNFWAGADPALLRPVAGLSVQGDCRSLFDSGSFPKNSMAFVPILSGIVGAAHTPDCLSFAHKGSAFLQLKRLAGAPLTAATAKDNRAYLQQQGRSYRFVSQPAGAATATYWPYLHQVFYVALQTQGRQQVPVLMRKRLVRQASGQLTMDTDSVLDGVEMMHFEAGIDSNFDGQVDYLSDVAQVSADVWQQRSGQVLQLRFYVLVRSVMPDNTYTNVQQYTLGQRLFQAPGDHYRRLLVSSAVTFHNY